MATSMSKWEIARYFIDAKKCIDTIWFIAKNIDNLNIDIRKHVTDCRDKFYINASVVVDKEVTYTGNKKAITSISSAIKTLFDYRNQHAAHKDDGFVDANFESLMDIVNDCKHILAEVKNVCVHVLPTEVTLDYVCYDRDLFRMLHNITKKKEDLIKQKKYPGYLKQMNMPATEFVYKKIFYDTEDIHVVDDKSNYCTVCEDGLTWDEGLQNRQDFCIKSNVLYGTNMWIHPNEKQVRAANLMLSKGYFDMFGIPQIPNKSPDEIQRDFEDLDRFMKMNV